MKRLEHELISRIASLFEKKGEGVVLGIGDDAAVLHYDHERYMVLTTDSLVEDVHFRLEAWSARELAIKAVRSNMSDIHAMGAIPHTVLISLALPTFIKDEWVDEFFETVKGEAQTFNFTVIGGNLTRASELSISLTATGLVPCQHLKKRMGAALGQALYLSGPVGYASLGLCELEKGKKESFFISAHKKTGVDIKKAAFLSSSPCVTAMIDVSDGLIQDLGHLLKASGVGARLDMSGLAQDLQYQQASIGVAQNPLELALYGGEDYVLLFSVEKEKEFLKQSSSFNFIRLGDVTASGVSVVYGGNEVVLSQKGFDHFK
ncbi:thiamine-phosphate kinase [bacterium]|nr:thiamine-phosphate kinase [bacterium]